MTQPGRNRKPKESGSSLTIRVENSPVTDGGERWRRACHLILLAGQRAESQARSKRDQESPGATGRGKRADEGLS